ncbi:hypothetical protein EDD63_10628 [Breznakia blatticola]|uniref:AAA domain-containing protein n=1 Tax=Breznakia blatticola TaxID=1754012 RepID=A0A4R8A3C9_9FIRM|nr:hypothetical protein [Breznakia blatticola]TDW25087.1 hypothetical protein EDD63_10628 [Breznakia blatticola]
MIIKKVAIGNSQEAYVESRINNGVNILFSLDNNKGKTVVLQSISYTLGASDSFPDGIDIKNYYTYLECTINEKDLKIVRRKNCILLIENEKLHIFDSISEFKYFVNSSIIPLPKYKKANKEKIVDFSVYYEMSIIPQDKRNPANIINKMGCNKDDFLKMIASIAGHAILPNSDLEKLKSDIKLKKDEKKNLEKKVRFIQSNKKVFESVSKTIDIEESETVRLQLQTLESEHIEIKKKRTREINRIIKLQELIHELNSLNRKVEEGNLICGECGSDKVIYIKKGFQFDTSNKDVRKNIISAIEGQILLKNEIVEEYNLNIAKIIDSKRSFMMNTPKETLDYLVYHEEIKNVNQYLEQIEKLDVEISELKNDLEISSTINGDENKKFLEVKNNIVNEMNKLQAKIELDTSTIYKDIFSTASKILSGSTENEYYFCRTVALSNVLKHDLPIIVDSFRDGELSTSKEKKMIDIYISLNKQVILSATLKDEEYANAQKKYLMNDNLNVIDYESVVKYNLLNESYVSEFKKLLLPLNIMI